MSVGWCWLVAVQGLCPGLLSCGLASVRVAPGGSGFKSEHSIPQSKVEALKVIQYPPPQYFLLVPSLRPAHIQRNGEQITLLYGKTVKEFTAMFILQDLIPVYKGDWAIQLRIGLLSSEHLLSRLIQVHDDLLIIASENKSHEEIMLTEVVIVRTG